MVKSKSKVKRGISKSGKAAKKAKPKKAIKKAKPASKKLIKQPVKKLTKADIPKISPKKDMDDLLPPPPPDYFKKKQGKEFKPSGHELTKLVINLKRDINFVVDKRKFLHMDDDQLEKFLTSEIIKILDILKDDNKYVKELKELDDKIQAYETLPNKGWLSARKVKEARNFIEGYKLVADETRSDIIERLESVRKDREVIERKQKTDAELADKRKIVESLEKPKVVQVKKVIEEKPKIKVEKLKIEKPKLLERFKAKPKEEQRPEKEQRSEKEQRPKEEQRPNTGVTSSQHQLRKHVFQLKKSLEHVSKTDGLLKKLENKIHLFSHKDLNGALDRLKETKEHLDKIEDIEEHVVAHASVPQMRVSHFKLNLAKKLLDKHNINVHKKKSIINEKISAVKSKIRKFEKENKAAKEKEAKLKEESEKFGLKISELKKHLKFIVSNKKLVETHDELLESLSLKELYQLSNKLNILKQYMGEIDSAEEHFAAESSKPGALTADKHLEDARKLIESYKIDTHKDEGLINYKLSAIKKQIKVAQEAAKKEPVQKAIPKPEKLPPKPKVKLEVKEEKPEIKEEKLEVPIPKFEKPDQELANSISRLKTAIKLVNKHEKIMKIADEKLGSYSPRKLLKVRKRLEILKQNIGELEDVEEHIAAESSTPKGLTAEKQIEDAKKIMDAANIDAAKNLKDINAKIKLVQDKLSPGEIPKPELKKAEKPEVKEIAKPELKEEVPEIKPAKGELPPMPNVAGVPSKELAIQIYRLERGLRFISGSEKLLQMSDDVLNSLGSWRLKRINKKLNVLKQKLQAVEDVEEHIAAESSTTKSPAIEHQLEKARQLMEAYAINPAKELKEVNSRMGFIGSKLGISEIPAPEAEEKPEPKVPEVKEPELKKAEKIPEVKGELEVPPPPKILGAIDKELASRISLLRKDLVFVANNQKSLEISDDTITSLSSWRQRRLTKKLNLLRQKLQEVEDIEEQIAAESSTKKIPAVEQQLEDAKHVLDSSKLDISKKLKEVDDKLEIVQPSPKPEIELKPELEHFPEVAVPQPEHGSEPELEKPKRRYHVIMESIKGKQPEIPLPPAKQGVPPPPGFKPSPFELHLMISTLRKDLNYLTKHEKYLHLPDEKVLSLSHKDFDRIFTQLKGEEQHINDLKNAEKKLSMYESIPNKGWLSTKKIREARALLNTYKSTNVNIARKMVINRLNLMNRRKQEIKTGRLQIAGEGIAQKKAKLAEDKTALKQAEKHLVQHEKEKFRGVTEDLRAVRQLKAAEKAKISLTRKPTGVIKQPRLEKPILDEAQREITQAIEAVKEKPIDAKDKIGYIMGRIDEARKALEDLDIGTAKDIYVNIHQVYRQMKPLEQFHVYEAMKGLYEDRKSAEQLVS